MNLTPYQQDVINAKICPYCKSDTVSTTQQDIYGKSYSKRAVIKCRNYPGCDAYVGCHDDGSPLGRLADLGLRQVKKQAHNVFDKIWKDKLMDRDTAYEQLADHLELPDKYTHIGMFSKQTCIKVIKWANNQYKELTA